MNFLKKTWSKLIVLFRQGLTPKQLALSLVISMLVSIFPMYGISTIILTFIAIPLKLNLPIMIGVSYIAEPIKIVLLIPFINIGAWFFGTEHTLLTFEAIKSSYNESFSATLKALSYELLCGFIGWTVAAIPLGILSYFILKGVLTYFGKLKVKKEIT
ncbi:MAG: DUF2062 domain-containing protein [Algibacter sp.]